MEGWEGEENRMGGGKLLDSLLNSATASSDHGQVTYPLCLGFPTYKIRVD